MPPDSAETTIADQTISSSSRPAEVLMRKPRPWVGEPKNSATIAPTSASVVDIFSPLKMNGSAAGSFSRQKAGH